MPPLSARRLSLCPWTRPRPLRFLPRLQIAHRSVPSRSSGPPPRFKSNAHKPIHKRLNIKGASPNAVGRDGRSLDSSKDDMIQRQVDALKEQFTEPSFLETLQLSRADFDKEWTKFVAFVNTWKKKEKSEVASLIHEANRGKDTLAARLKFMFYAQLYDKRFTASEQQAQKDVADLRYPSEWYPATREIPRTVHLHVGPTNSGKTYRALKRLENARRGVYLGPLRLLAHEVYTRLNALGKSCALITGEEQRIPESFDPRNITKHFSAMFSCTVEMAPLNRPFDVAVIDEIQMINHPERGWAWTQAFLGLQATEIHLCGEARTVPIMRELCALVGDKVHVHNYERLSPLVVQPRSLDGALDDLEKGDCVVAFSVISIHALRNDIEKKTRKKCAIVYGGLPPETRAQQARLFNDPDNDYDYLVASDAIGMGLNLAIKRVIFESTIKSNGINYVPLEVSEVKQIAGRAGRYKTAHDAVQTNSSNTPAAVGPVDSTVDLDDVPSETAVKKEVETKSIGWVTTLDQVDHNYLKICMKREAKSIKTAGLIPPPEVIERFASYFPPGTPFSYILLRMNEFAEMHPRFHMCSMKENLTLADEIHTVKNLTTKERIILCAAPLSTRSATERRFLRLMAECIADHKSGHLLDLEGVPWEVMDTKRSGSRQYMYGLEQLHKVIVGYLWLSYRFPNVFVSRTLANYAKKLVEDEIAKTLNDFSFVEQARAKMLRNRSQARRRGLEDGAQNVEPDDETNVSSAEIPQGSPTEANDLVKIAPRHGPTLVESSEQVRASL